MRQTKTESIFRTLTLYLLATATAVSLAACRTEADPADTRSTTEPTSANISTDPLHYGLYIQNGQLFYADFTDEIRPIQIGDNLIDGDPSYWYNYGYVTYVYLSPDGRYIIYPQGQQSAAGTAQYLLDLTDPEQTPLLLCSGYIESISRDFDRITFIASGNLYQHDLTEATLLASDISTFEGLQISDDGRSVLYVTQQDRSLYLIQDGKEPEQIATDVTWFEAAEDFETVFYIRDKTLYVKQQGRKPQMIAAGAYAWSVIVYENGTAYCFAEDQEDIYLLDHFEGGKTEYTEFYSDLYIDSPYKTLYYFDGSRTHLICDAALQNYCQDHAEDTAAVTYIAAEKAELPIWPMSEPDCYLYLIEDHVNANTGFYLAVEDEAVRLVDDQIEGFLGSISDDGKYLYLGLYSNDARDAADRYRLTLQGTQVTETELVAEDAATYSLFEAAGDSIVYLRDLTRSGIQWSEEFDDYYSIDSGSLYIDFTYVDDNVEEYTLLVDEENRNGLIYYLKDWSPETFGGTLRVYDGTQAATLMDNVHEMALCPGGELLFLRNYDYTVYAGELWVYRNGTCEKIANDVNQIVSAQKLS